MNRFPAKSNHLSTFSKIRFFEALLPIKYPEEGEHVVESEFWAFENLTLARKFGCWRSGKCVENGSAFMIFIFEEVTKVRF